ncbi:unnamed protein product [Adineta steineri]|uniref:Uncharacterized protein n=1 Tax=Adineta steineri TaxID=433720 RepID=A0A815UKU1_9BILA|nr:unnamed protein product [Adineta steineri]CAF1649096.1 unnamed protein product [Adineta steineri]
MYITNGDQYNIEIKQLANEKYIESCLYTIKTVKKEKFALKDKYLEKRNDVARNALKAETVQEGANIMKNDFPWEYIVHGDKMRGNVEYELRETKKQQLIDYKPIYDPITFKIPDEHREQIQEWIDNNFRKRINGEISRSRCLFMVGPTQHEIHCLEITHEEFHSVEYIDTQFFHLNILTVNNIVIQAIL